MTNYKGRSVSLETVLGHTNAPLSKNAKTIALFHQGSSNDNITLHKPDGTDYQVPSGKVAYIIYINYYSDGCLRRNLSETTAADASTGEIIIVDRTLGNYIAPSIWASHAIPADSYITSCGNGTGTWKIYIIILEVDA